MSATRDVSHGSVVHGQVMKVCAHLKGRRTFARNTPKLLPPLCNVSANAFGIYSPYQVGVGRKNFTPESVSVKRPKAVIPRVLDGL